MSLQESTRERYSRRAWSTALLVGMGWLCWPSLSFQRVTLEDRESLNTFASLSLFDALGHVGHACLRPGENALLWLIAHSGSLLPWRALLLGVFLITTAFVEYEARARGGSRVDGFGAAAWFAVNPTTLSVVCSVSTAYVALCALGILVYVECARRALALDARRGLHVVGALAGLVFALAFYELAVFAPLAIIAYQLLLRRGVVGRRGRWLYLGSAVCVISYALLQMSAAGALHFWAHESPSQVIANSMRYCAANFWLWFNPFATFGVLVADAPGSHTIDNLLCWLLNSVGVVVVWRLRRTDPASAFGGVWFLIFMVPANTLLHFEGSPIALQHVYIPMLALALTGVRIATRLLERLSESITHASLRVIVGSVLSLVFLWSVAPLIAECHRAVVRWGDEERLYLCTLQNYPQSAEVLGRLTRDYLAVTPRSSVRPVRSSNAWQGVIDVILLEPPPDVATSLIPQGRALAQRSQYIEAGSTLARALEASATRDEYFEAGVMLVQALSHTEQRASASGLLQRLRREYPTRAELRDVGL
jgi:hypothetical protein